MSESPAAGPRCPLCGADAAERLELPYPLFRHLDFGPFQPAPARLASCKRCRLVYRDLPPGVEPRIDELYRGEEYARHGEGHAVVTAGGKEPSSLPSLQAELLLPFVPAKGARVLDVGCFDGSLLRELGKRVDAAELRGFDVAPRAGFPAGAPFKFVSGSLDAVSGRFDLITLSHSIQYIRDIPGLFARIRALLAEGGALFIQAPDFSAKPCNLLLGDLYYHYTPAIMDGLLRRMGFEPEPVANASFPRDILVVARPAAKPAGEPAAGSDQVRSSLARLQDMAKGISRLPRHPRRGVLGTTIEAAFAGHLLGDAVSFFVDENPGKVGTRFHGREVRHPRALTAADAVVIPMGAAGERIRERLSKRYPAEYDCV